MSKHASGSIAQAARDNDWDRRASDASVNAPGRFDVKGYPVASQNRPQHLVHVRSVFAERAPQDRFARRAQLAQRTVAAAVLHDRARFEATDGQRLEREADHLTRGRLKYSRSPEL